MVFWKIREEITPLYAVEYGGSRINGGELTIYAPGKQIRSRGDILNLGMLTIRITSPMEDILKISVSHFEGAADPGPFTGIEEYDPRVNIVESEEQIIFQTGNTKAVVDKQPDSWGIRFLDGDRELTSTGLKNMAYMKNRDNGKCYMVEQLALDVGEYVYGMGERFTPFVKNGQIVEMWNEDGGTASEIAYKNIPFYLTNKGYGVLVSNPGDVSYEVASEKVERIQFSLEGERLDYYIINGGTPKGTIKKYTDLTGKPSLPPAWSFGLWLTTSFTTDYDEETTSGFIDGMAKRDIPLRRFFSF